MYKNPCELHKLGKLERAFEQTSLAFSKIKEMLTSQRRGEFSISEGCDHKTDHTGSNLTHKHLTNVTMVLVFSAPKIGQFRKRILSYYDLGLDILRSQ